MITRFLVLANFFLLTLLANRLQLNTSKTDLFWSATSRRRHQLPNWALRIGSDLVKPSASVRDLGIYFDADLSMRCHIQKTVANCFAVAQYPTINSDVSIPTLVDAVVCHGFATLTTAMLCWRALYQPIPVSSVSDQRCRAIDRRPTTLQSHHRHTRQVPLVEGPWAYLVQAGDNRLSFTERYGSSLPGCRSAPFVWYAVHPTSEIVTHWPVTSSMSAMQSHCSDVSWLAVPPDIVACDTLSRFRREFRYSYHSILF